ncbi:deoxyribose-phosphate aldolase [Paenibacillus psychroresistens]|uniref:Deoxyribose-phosphate aldolase n=1 Tax=Paenibacillus psychroresistens TaxID=1778678 RepID=A0A6B8RJA0_9BACL|nr:deoxyribose-phosphate aldolase [Paenibacillus psychroresistens]QGQ95685.1 deoxyribose-phosphate aldolase [Paenibacillus psychroresistens]
MKSEQIAAMIDHTLLKADGTHQDIIQLCEEAKLYNFATVCVNPYWVPLAAQELQGSRVGITTVIGFPLGASSTLIKAAEARDSIKNGATEVDMVLNVGAMKSGDYQAVQQDIREVAQVCQGNVILKVIIETCYLTDAEKQRAAQLCQLAGADFVKTSTGFGPTGATIEDIQLIRATVGDSMGIKASGGVRDLSFALQLIEAGATRLGTSSGIALVSGGIGTGY